MLTDMYIPNYKYMFVYIYMIYWNTFLPFFGPWHIAARPAWSPLFGHTPSCWPSDPHQGDGCVRLDERDVGRWGLWGSLACYGNFFGRAGSTQKMEVYSWEIIERWWIFHCLVEMMTDFACLSLSEHVRKDLLNGNFAWGNIYDDQCS